MRKHRKRIADNIIDLVGKTPLVYLNRFSAGCPGTIVGKLEWMNPTGSVKDRIVLNMIQDAGKRHTLNPGDTVVEPTSGNTGISLAAYCAVSGFRLILVMPDTIGHERRQVLQAYGAELVITPADRGMRGAIEEAERIVSEEPRTFMAQQFINPANPEAHQRTTGAEIWKDTLGEVAAVVAGIGTGGTITGVGRYLKGRNPDVRIIAVEPSLSPALSGGQVGRHGIYGIGPGFVPKTLDAGVIDQTITVEDQDAKDTCVTLAKTEGLLVGVSSGAAAWAARRVALDPVFQDKTIVVIFPDSGVKYLSTGIFS